MIPRPRFHLRSGAPTTSGEVSIRCIFYVDRRQVYLSTGYRCKPSQWDARRDRMKPAARHATLVNAALDRMEAKVRAMLGELHEAGALTAESARARWDEMHTPPPPAPETMPTLGDAFERWKVERRDLRAKGTIAIYETSVRHLEAMLGRPRGEITIGEIGVDMLARYAAYIVQVKRNCNDSVWKCVRPIRTLLGWCRDKGMQIDLSYLKATRSELLKETESMPSRSAVALTIPEYRQFRDYDLSPWPSLERVRDTWCFQATTGLRWGDMVNLAPEHRLGDILDLTTMKTRRAIRVPLAGDALRIWERYGGPPPTISAQDMNKFLKDAARQAGLERKVRLTMYRGVQREERTVMLWEVLSTHVAKKTFVTSLIAAGCTVDDVMRVTGNSRRTIETYIRLDQEEVEAKVREKLNQR